jgi:hypothetical protein
MYRRLPISLFVRPSVAICAICSSCAVRMSLVAAVTAAAGTVADPHGYGETVARQLYPDVLPYVIGTPATFGFAVRNGRTLADNAPEVMLSLVTGTAVPSGLTSAVASHQRASGFPYVIPA